MEALFYKIQKNFCRSEKQAQRQQQRTEEPREQTAEQTRRPQPRGAEQQEIAHEAQRRAQRHEQAQLPAPCHAAQQKQHKRRQYAERRVGCAPAPDAEPPQALRQQIIAQTQRRAAGQREQRLQPLRSGVDLHQPSSRPSRPRRAGAASE